MADPLHDPKLLDALQRMERRIEKIEHDTQATTKTVEALDRVVFGDNRANQPSIPQQIATLRTEVKDGNDTLAKRIDALEDTNTKLVNQFQGARYVIYAIAAVTSLPIVEQLAKLFGVLP